MSAALAAFVLDCLIGDPFYAWHPVRIMGRIIAGAENILRRSRLPLRAAGAVLALGLPIAVFASSFALLALLAKIHPLLAWIVNVYGIYSALSIRDLHQEAVRVYAALRSNDLERGRQSVARIVGRDTESLDRKGIARAAVETVAESTLDGIIAPLFYALIGGAPLALAYKAVNTLDSMIGHLNEKYREFGYFAAKQDEMWNWIPALASCFFIAAAAVFEKVRPAETFFTGWEHGVAAKRGAGIVPIAAFAGALGIKLGGPLAYEGKIVDKPVVGFGEREVNEEDIRAALRLMILSAVSALLFGLLLRYAIGLCLRLM